MGDGSGEWRDWVSWSWLCDDCEILYLAMEEFLGRGKGNGLREMWAGKCTCGT